MKIALENDWIWHNSAQTLLAQRGPKRKFNLIISSQKSSLFSLFLSMIDHRNAFLRTTKGFSRQISFARILWKWKINIINQKYFINNLFFFLSARLDFGCHGMWLLQVNRDSTKSHHSCSLFLCALLIRTNIFDSF